MSVAVALLYWVIVALWIAILTTLIVFVVRRGDIARTMGLLILVLVIDTVRNIVENIFFGVYWGAELGLFPASYAEPLRAPLAVAIPKVINLIAGSMVLGILVLRWMPAAVRERARAAERLAEAENRIAALTSSIDSTATAVVLMDASQPDRPVVFVNRAFVNLTGVSRDDLLGRPLKMRAAPGTDPAITRGLEQAIEKGQQHVATFQIDRGDGVHLWTEIAIARAEMDGALALLVLCCRDASEKQELREQVNEGQRLQLVGMMASGVVHDFNNMLTVVLSNLDTIKGNNALSVRDRSALGMIAEATKRSSDLARHFLAYSRQKPKSDDLVMIDEAVRDSVRLLESSLAKNIFIELDLNGGDATAKIDKVRFENAIVNLCVNARDAMPAGGALKLSTVLERDSGGLARFVSVNVADTGHGMTPEVLRRAFEPFFTTKPEGKGHGIGLSSVRQFVEEADGALDVTTAVGAGTTIHIRLPLALPVAEAAPRIAARA